MRVPSCGVTFYCILRHPVLYSRLSVFKPPERNSDKWTISASLEKACLLINEGDKKCRRLGFVPVKSS